MGELRSLKGPINTEQHILNLWAAYLAMDRLSAFEGISCGSIATEAISAKSKYPCWCTILCIEKHADLVMEQHRKYFLKPYANLPATYRSLVVSRYLCMEVSLYLYQLFRLCGYTAGNFKREKKEKKRKKEERFSLGNSSPPSTSDVTLVCDLSLTCDSQSQHTS